MTTANAESAVRAVWQQALDLLGTAPPDARIAPLTGLCAEARALVVTARGDAEALHCCAWILSRLAALHANAGDEPARHDCEVEAASILRALLVRQPDDLELRGSLCELLCRHAVSKDAAGGTRINAALAREVLDLAESIAPLQPVSELEAVSLFTLMIQRAIAARDDADRLALVADTDRLLAIAERALLTPAVGPKGARAVADMIGLKAAQLTRLGRLEEALATMDRSLGLHRHAAEHPEADDIELLAPIDALEQVLGLLTRLGRTDDLIHARRELEAANQRLADRLGPEAAAALLESVETPAEATA